MNAQFCVCAQSGNTLGHGGRAEERSHPKPSLSICYSWREIKNIGYLQCQIQGCKEVSPAI